MLQAAGRPICAAMRLLLSQHRLLAASDDKRLAALLEDSRKFQNEVSERLAEQVLHALYELVRGFQAAHDRSDRTLLRDVLAEHPDEVYRGLLTVLLRLVFLLYAEERGMLPDDEAFLQCYSLIGLHERLREDAALNPDTMDQRYGAWAQLLVLFRMVFDGAEWDGTRLPRRHGVLFDPDRFTFLEGRPAAGARQVHERIDAPRVPDGTVFRVLEKLRVLDGERITYRALDVEQIGSVYETMMGFRLETAMGRSIAIKATKKHGAPATVNLDALLAQAAGKRTKWIQDHADRKVPTSVSNEVKEAGTLEELHAAVEKIADTAATPDLVPRGAMVLQPSEERRKSGSHYTPRELTAPIVSTTLRPILERLRESAAGIPTPEQILDQKICDPAMGSGAFLVEACRQLGDALLEAWKAHGGTPELPPDEDELVFARRMVAQRCLYGVDRNPVAVDLAKVSLWLVTLAKEHAFTFLDHAVRHGDSLLGLSRKQIESFHWDPDVPRFQAGFEVMRVQEHLAKISRLRHQIREAGEEIPDWELRGLWDEAASELGQVRLYGDLVVAAYFEGSKEKEREANRALYARDVAMRDTGRHRSRLQELRSEDPPLIPFHWELEFPEVFDRDNGGFDGFVGNPPFGGHITVSDANRAGYTEWLRTTHAQSKGKCDVVAHFFRRAFSLLRTRGAMGFIATNSIAQGDTRESGLGWISRNGGTIYSARKRVRWPGEAAVIVSVVHLARGPVRTARELDAKQVSKITPFLFRSGSDSEPASLRANQGLAYQGTSLVGMGFTFDDTETKGVAGTAMEMRQLIEERPERATVIKPYIGGADLNASPSLTPYRFAIDLGSLTEDEARSRWPKLVALLEERVKPERMLSAKRSKSSHAKRVAIWWQHYHKADELYAALEGLEYALPTSYVSTHHAFGRLPTGIIFANTLAVVALQSYSAFAALQARPHEAWARFFGSSLKDDLRYTPSDVFETFPFPSVWTERGDLEVRGQEYYEFRAELMVRNNEGLTKTYNRFHDPDDRSPDIIQLRDFHAGMDRAVLDAYGWTDIPTECEFLLDYEVDEKEQSRRKKPWRLRWPDEVHDEVLSRLLELNAARAEQERVAGGAVNVGGVAKAVRPRDVDDIHDHPDLFDE